VSCRIKRRPRRTRVRRRQTSLSKPSDRKVVKLARPSGTQAKREWDYLLHTKCGSDVVAPHIIGVRDQVFTSEVIPQSFIADQILLVSMVTVVQVKPGRRRSADKFYLSRINRPGLFYYFPDLPWNSRFKMKRIIHFLLSSRCRRAQTVFGQDFKRLYLALKARHRGRTGYSGTLHPVFDHLSVQQTVRLSRKKSCEE
jgi:hypothetical protein